MKLLYTYILPLFLVLCSGLVALAYQPGPDIIRECPKCKAAVKQATMMSGNTVGARFWTDGKMLAPMLPDRPWLVKCPKCSGCFWTDEAKELRKELSGSKDRKWPNALRPNLPTEADLLTLLAGEPLSMRKELYIRRRAWWAANDLIRTNKSATISWSPAQKANLEALAKLMDEQDPEHRITKAEILRELKKFDKCIALLKAPFEKAHQTEVAAFIMRLAEQKLWTVHEIKQDKKPSEPHAGYAK